MFAYIYIHSASAHSVGRAAGTLKQFLNVRSTCANKFSANILEKVKFFFIKNPIQFIRPSVRRPSFVRLFVGWLISFVDSFVFFFCYSFIHGYS